MIRNAEKGSAFYLSVICLITTLGGFLFGFEIEAKLTLMAILYMP
jgi:hypothetical protein